MGVTMEGREAAVCECMTEGTRRVVQVQEPVSRESLPRIRSSELLDQGSCVIIEHGREEYRLRLTRLGKLILTK